MALLLLWTAVIAAVSCIGTSAMPMLPEMDRLPPAQAQALLELYQAWQVREMEREMQQQQVQLQQQQQVQQQQPQVQLQPQDLRQLKQWVEMQLSRLELEDSAASTMAPPQPKRGNYMALCHFKICNMGRKRSPRPQDMP